MVKSIENIKAIALDELIGMPCYVADYDGKMTCCIITRVDLFISKSGTGVNAHLKKVEEGTINCPLCVTLENYTHNVSHEPKGFLSPFSYAKYYSELG